MGGRGEKEAVCSFIMHFGQEKSSLKAQMRAEHLGREGKSKALRYC